MPKHLRFIEPSFTITNPSTNGLVGVVSQLADEGWDIEIWCRELDPSLEGKVRIKRIPAAPAPAHILVFIDFIIIHLMAITDLIRGNPRPDITITTGFLYLPADLATVHFSHFDWFGRLCKMGILRDRETIFETLKSSIGLITEILLFYNPWPTRLLPVSLAVADDLHAWAAPWKNIELVPNCILGTRFSPSVRARHRDRARQDLGFDDGHIVLAFASNGHFFRKNLAAAVATTAILRQRGHRATLLVIGGREKTLNFQKTRLAAIHPDFNAWTRFTGQVDDMPFHLSAADAFFFPSHSEAFSLVEIEAAALGIPLFLTPHHGSEMILRDGKNGRLLPWEPAAMADVLENEILNGLQPVHPPDTGKALSKSEYQDAWHHLLEHTQ
jgi:glycosyltransferase involved in cell wall biosynthesis